MKPFVALLGVGRWGERLLRVLDELKVVGWVYTRSLAKHQNLQALYPHLRWTEKLEEVWKEPLCRAVVIATPAPTHPELIEAALQAGKDVFCEKPIAFSVAQLHRLIGLAEERGLILMGGHILHYHPAIEAIQSLLSRGALGKLLSIHSERTAAGRFPLAEDALWGLAIHDLGVFLYILDQVPSKSRAYAQDSLTPTKPESIHIHLEFPSGVRGQIFTSWLYPERRRKISLIGTEGMVVFSDESKPTLTFYPHRVRWQNGQEPRVEWAAQGEPIPLPEKEPLRVEIEDFIEAIQKRRAPRTAAQALLPTIALAEKLHRTLFPEVETPRPYFVHPTAVIDEDVEIGEGTKIWHFSHILRGSRIGKNCVLGQNVVVGPFVRIGNHCKIQNNVSLYYGVELEDGVLCGPSCVFTNDKYPRAFIDRRNEFLQTRVRQGATIGANATIMCGTTIGRFAMVGAGAVVLHDVPDHALVVGNPARQVGWVCECGETLREIQPDHLFHCDRCNLFYKRTLKGLEKITQT
ncbi:MAG: Gfo/Idh/MocA family oxidoreductase [Bacteroidia bacterium]|nr:Gfo/Idh/MocA family oxidoreductase [Bacteroidia bacterium]